MKQTTLRRLRQYVGTCYCQSKDLPYLSRHREANHIVSVLSSRSEGVPQPSYRAQDAVNRARYVTLRNRCRGSARAHAGMAVAAGEVLGEGTELRGQAWKFHAATVILLTNCKGIQYVLLRQKADLSTIATLQIRHVLTGVNETEACIHPGRF